MPPTDVTIARINARQVIIVTLITGLSGVMGALVQNKVITPRRRDAVVGDDSASHRLDLMAREHDLLYLLTADAVERDLPSEAELTERGGRERRLRALRRAVFLNLGRVGGDERITAATLAALVERGHFWIAAEREPLMTEYAGLRAARLAWLQDVAIPQAERARRPGTPLLLSLPAAVGRVARGAAAPDKVLVSDLAGLRREVTLLSRASQEASWVSLQVVPAGALPTLGGTRRARATTTSSR